jgi:dihydrodipicolinate synthase/N-acetylneuraminate lyase
MSCSSDDHLLFLRRSFCCGCAGYSGHLFAQTVLERQGVVVVVRQALFERMALVASTGGMSLRSFVRRSGGW